MLRSLGLKDFKSFADETVPLGALTLLVGANASGKSNFLDAIRFLQGIGLDMSVADVLRGRWEGGREIWPGLRGGLKEVTRGTHNEFRLEAGWRIDAQRVMHGITCRTTPSPVVTAESLVAEGLGQYLFDTHAASLGASVGIQPGDSINVALRGTGGGRNPSAFYSASRSLLGQVDKRPRVDPSVMEWARKVEQATKECVFLDIMPRRMRDYVPRQVTELGANGENISAIVFRYCQDADHKQELVDWLSELCAPDIADIDFIETELDEVLLVLIEKSGARVSARSVSDGTLRFLGELIALKTAAPGSILLLEEIENGLHPMRAHLLVELLEGVVDERKIQVLATTHSPVVLAALSENRLEQAVVFARLAGAEGTVAKRLGDLPSFSEIASKKSVDALFTTGWLERAL